MNGNRFLIQSKNFNSSSTIERKENLDHTVPQKVAKFNLSNRIVHFTILNIYSDGNSTPSLYIKNNFTVLLSLYIYICIYNYYYFLLIVKQARIYFRRKLITNQNRPSYLDTNDNANLKNISVLFPFIKI